MRKERQRLEHHAETAPIGRQRRDILAVEQHAPADGASSPAISRSKVVFPQPDGPRKQDELAEPDIERDPVEGGEGAELLAEFLDR